jgi:hypothetical protein
MEPSGKFHFVELKHLPGNRMEIRPAQVSWLSRHRAGSVWILARQDIKRNATWRVCLFKAEQAVDLALEKFVEVKPYFEMTDPEQWQELVKKIFES